MTRYERKLFFERLVTMRDAYRTETQVALDLTVDAVMLYAQATYDAIAAADTDRETAPATGTTGSGPTAATAD